MGSRASAHTLYFRDSSLTLIPYSLLLRSNMIIALAEHRYSVIALGTKVSSARTSCPRSIRSDVVSSGSGVVGGLMASAADLKHVVRKKLVNELTTSCLLVLLVCYSCLLAGVDSQNISNEEMLGLQALQKAWSMSVGPNTTQVDNWRNSSLPCGRPPKSEDDPLNTEVDPYKWEGVSCNFSTTWPTGATVTGLELANTLIAGVLPPEVSMLRNLETIIIIGNRYLSGAVPSGIVQLLNLTYLALSGNQFTGKAPDVSRLFNLRELYLSSNWFTGQAPDVSQLTHLEYLDLSSNTLQGQAPEISQLSQLKKVSLSVNEFTGQAPIVSQLKNLTWLDLSFNKLQGQAPEISQLAQLEMVSLSFNEFTGQAPDVSQLKNLTYLDLAFNKLEGPAPKISQLSQLDFVDLSSNKFTGQAPDVLQLQYLTFLDLSFNKLMGQVPETSELSQLTIVRVSLSSNEFTGQVPDVSQLIQMSFLNLSCNEFTGQAPNVSQLTLLMNLDLSFNKLEGQAPKISELLHLETLNLSSNKFTSQAPNVSQLTSLMYLDLSQNNFTGPVPEVSPNATSIIHINFSSNFFSGFTNKLSPFLNRLPKSLQSLDLSCLGIGGSAPTDWANISMPSLSSLYLDKNNFTGTLNISEVLQSNISKSLKVLSLRDNMITGVITSEGLPSAAGLTSINLQGNPFCSKSWTSEVDASVCTFYCGHPCVFMPVAKVWKVVTISTSISSALILLVILGFAFALRRKRKYIRELQRKLRGADINAKRFEYNELRTATKNFAPEMKLGEGAYGAVYKGILVSNVVVAVKQLFLKTDASRDDFLNEVLLIANLQHRNLVTLKGYCLHDRQTLLVYEYVDNCDLDKILLSRHSNMVLDWQARLNICQGVAQGLYYLHASSQFRIIHRDIKASNILLDKNLQPKIADFGLARPMEDAQSVILTNQCAGTLGYLAPEYMCHGQLSDKADVYSFGVLLLEIVSGKRNRDLTMPEDEVYLPIRAWKLGKENRLLDLKDPAVPVSEEEAEEVQRVLQTAVLCVQNAPEKRPSMFMVAAMLAGKANVDPSLDALSLDEEVQGMTWERSPESIMSQGWSSETHFRPTTR